MRRILIFFKKSIQLFKNYSLIGLFVDGNVYKTTNKSPMIHTNQILLCSNWLELSPSSFTHIFKNIETTMRWNCMSKALCFLQITAKHQDCPFVTVFLTIKTSSHNISIALSQISLKLHQHRGRYWRKKLPWTILEEQFPVPRYTAASKIGNSVISLLWQLRCHCNPDHDKFSSLSNTTVVAIFPDVCVYGDIVYAQTWQVLSWNTLLSHFHIICQYGLCCCIVWPSFHFDCFLKLWATCKIFLCKFFTPSPPPPPPAASGKKLPVRLWNQ